ncbi:MAG: hypothetical protein GX946_08165 [Oligosphaeraceae bacterium]|nr:hypothetical protein [Oligosphaeraceae bacterium]
MDELFSGKTLRVLLYGRNLEDLLPLLQDFPAEIVQENPELVITHGGDGSLLGAERLYPGVPKCPMRDRRQNPKCALHSEINTLEKLFRGELQKSYPSKVAAYLDSGTPRLLGLNDLVLSRGLLSSAIRYRIWVDGQLFCPQVVSDSLVLSSPFGSTGYFQSITHGNFRVGLGLAFNNAMDGLDFCVLPEDAVVKVQLLRGPAHLLADNNPQVCELVENDCFSARLIKSQTLFYGMDVFRCQECYQLRRKGC